MAVAASTPITKPGWWAVISPGGQSGLVYYGRKHPATGWAKVTYLGNSKADVRRNWHLAGHVDPRLTERNPADALKDADKRPGGVRGALYKNPTQSASWDLVPTAIWVALVTAGAGGVVLGGATAATEAGGAAAAGGGAAGAEAAAGAEGAAGGTAAGGAAGGASGGAAAAAEKTAATTLGQKLAGAGAAAAVLSFIADPHLWLRLVEIVGGVMLLAMGLKAFTGGAVDPVGAVRKVTPL